MTSTGPISDSSHCFPETVEHNHVVRSVLSFLNEKRGIDFVLKLDQKDSKVVYEFEVVDKDKTFIEKLCTVEWKQKEVPQVPGDQAFEDKVVALSGSNRSFVLQSDTAYPEGSSLVIAPVLGTKISLLSEWDADYCGGQVVERRIDGRLKSGIRYEITPELQSLGGAQMAKSLGYKAYVVNRQGEIIDRLAHIKWELGPTLSLDKPCDFTNVMNLSGFDRSFTVSTKAYPRGSQLIVKATKPTNGGVRLTIIKKVKPYDSNDVYLISLLQGRCGGKNKYVHDFTGSEFEGSFDLKPLSGDVESATCKAYVVDSAGIVLDRVAHITWKKGEVYHHPPQQINLKGSKCDFYVSLDNACETLMKQLPENEQGAMLMINVDVGSAGFDIDLPCVKFNSWGSPCDRIVHYEIDHKNIKELLNQGIKMTMKPNPSASSVQCTLDVIVGTNIVTKTMNINWTKGDSVDQ